MNNEDLKDQLNNFLQKTWCRYTQDNARRILNNISKYIPKEYLTTIEIELSHVLSNIDREQSLLALKDEVEKFKETL